MSNYGFEDDGDRAYDADCDMRAEDGRPRGVDSCRYCDGSGHDQQDNSDCKFCQGTGLNARARAEREAKASS